MKEREILEKAAKAADVEITWENSLSHPERIERFRGLPNHFAWNPLEDNADAFALAVKMGFRVCVNNESGFSWVKNFVGSYPHGDDAEFATRLAIVMAAAQSFDKQQKSKAQPSPSKSVSET